ncbi:carbohydrate ABC transporter permease [Agrobacterium tumefaciens]|uniref:carbohydrate ABC transporter permease n=1 Tax=Agrobacterium tumefaciens TaxID=358 RepID=UPI001F359BE7|nr:hypothetical protein [Agrobacterium tumefaciens]
MMSLAPHSTGEGPSLPNSSFTTHKALRKHRLTEIFTAWSLGGPALLLLVTLFFLPVFAVFAIVLTDWQFGATSMSFVGFGNFREVFADEGFRASFVNTLIYVVIVVPGTLVLGLAIALLIESGKSCRAFYRWSS